MTAKVNNKKNKNNPPLSTEIIGMSIVLISLIILICIYIPSIFGMIGLFLSSFIIGLLGFSGYIFPFTGLFLGSYIFILGELSNNKLKIYLVIIGLILLASLIHTLTFDKNMVYSNFTEYLLSHYQNGSLGNGGLIGSFFGNIAIILTGRIGSFIIFLIGFIVILSGITGKNLNRHIFYSLKKLINKYKYYLDKNNDYDEDTNTNNDIEKETDSLVQKKPRDQINYISKSKNIDKAKIFTIETTENKNNTILLFSEEIEDFNYGLNQRNEPKINIDKTLEDTVEEFASCRKDIYTPIKDRETIETEIKINSSQPLEEDRKTINYKLEKELLEVLEDPKEVEIQSQAYKEIVQERANSILGIENTESKSSSSLKDMYNVPTKTNLQTKLEENIKTTKEEVYIFPPIELLKKNNSSSGLASKSQILENSKKLETTLKSFGVEARVIEVSKGPTVTRYELSPGEGVKVSKISNLADDLALSLASTGIRIEAPIPGKSAVGIEIPNKEVNPVFLREVLEDKLFINFPSNLAFGVGKDITGNTIIADISKMPHMLIAGATGSGKSVCINTLITSLIYKSSPKDVKILMIDPKVVELSIYNGIPHLLIPVVTDPKKAAGALNWAVKEMVDRYNLFAENSVRDLKGYNRVLKEKEEQTIPQIVIIIDELSDLMMAAPGEVENAICRLAQMARAAGLHLIIATQRPSVDVITGVIKANIPSRLAFSVSSGIDSRTILDSVGAEKLLGKGDMLFLPIGMNKPKRIQGAYISDKEVENIVNFIKRGNTEKYDAEMIEKITSSNKMSDINEEVDELFTEAIKFIIEKEKASASMLQRQFRIGYNRAARLVEDLEAQGIVGPEDGSKPRKVLISMDEFLEWQKS